MLVVRSTKVVGVFVAVSVLAAGYARAARPTADEIAQHDLWVREHGISFWMPYHGSGFSAIVPYVVRSLMGPIVG